VKLGSTIWNSPSRHDPINGRRYVQLGTTVHLITDMYFYQIDADLPAFVSTHLLPDKASITSLTLRKCHCARMLRSVALQPDQPGISADAIQTLITAWRESTAYGETLRERHCTRKDHRTSGYTRAGPAIRHNGTEPELILARPDLGCNTISTRKPPRHCWIWARLLLVRHYRCGHQSTWQ